MGLFVPQGRLPPASRTLSKQSSYTQYRCYVVLSAVWGFSITVAIKHYLFFLLIFPTFIWNQYPFIHPTRFISLLYTLLHFVLYPIVPFLFLQFLLDRLAGYVFWSMLADKVAHFNGLGVYSMTNCFVLAACENLQYIYGTALELSHLFPDRLP